MAVKLVQNVIGIDAKGDPIVASIRVVQMIDDKGALVHQDVLEPEALVLAQRDAKLRLVDTV